MKYAISYVSTEAPHMNAEDIHTVLKWSKDWNNDNRITGILLFSEGNFFQVLEGEKHLLLELFKRIKADKRHYNVIKIFEKEIFDPTYKEYQVDFISLDSRYRKDEIDPYFSQVKNLNPAIQNSVKYILQQFTEGF